MSLFRRKRVDTETFSDCTIKVARVRTGLLLLFEGQGASLEIVLPRKSAMEFLDAVVEALEVER